VKVSSKSVNPKLRSLLEAIVPIGSGKARFDDILDAANHYRFLENCDFGESWALARYFPIQVTPNQVRKKRSHGKGEAAEKIRFALLHHHGYDNGLVGNYAPIGVRELARLASKGTDNVSPASVTNFMNRNFSQDGKSNGHANYRALCRIQGGSRLGNELKVLAGEMLPREFRQHLSDQYKEGTYSLGGEGEE
jgi:hypothetical protein